MTQLTFLNKKKTKEILSILDRQWGLKGLDKDYGDLLDYVFMTNTKDRIFIINRQISDINLEQLRMDSMGLYFGKFKEADGSSKKNESRKNKDKKKGKISRNEIRLTIEGSQIIGPLAAKNVIEISDGLMKLWIRGHDIEINRKEKEDNMYVIVKNNDDFVGCGRLSGSKIFNHIPKSRRVMSED
ncbi:MAG: hypothetical protein ABIG89_00845 [Candidatus Woesearchaeota archaeon]